MKNLNHIFVAFILASTMASCQKEDIGLSTSQDASQSGSTSLGLKTIDLTSSPGLNSNDYGAIEFEIKEVEAFVENQGWVKLNSESQIISVLNMENGSSIRLSQTQEFKPGSISKIKLIFGQENFVFAGNLSGVSKVKMDFESSNEAIIDVQNGIFIDGQLLLNIDLDKSIIKEGSTFIFKPIIAFLKDAKTGIKGSVEGVVQAMVTLRNESLTYRAFLTSTGEFLVRDVEEGTYNLIVEPISNGLNNFSKKEFPGIIIIRNRITTTGEIQF